MNIKPTENPSAVELRGEPTLAAYKLRALKNGEMVVALLAPTTGRAATFVLAERGNYVRADALVRVDPASGRAERVAVDGAWLVVEAVRAGKVRADDTSRRLWQGAIVRPATGNEVEQIEAIRAGASKAPGPNA